LSSVRQRNLPAVAATLVAVMARGDEVLDCQAFPNARARVRVPSPVTHCRACPFACLAHQLQRTGIIPWR